MVTAGTDQEQRSREIADTTRRYLVALNTGGVGTTLAVASTLAGKGIEPGWAVWPTAVFVMGLTMTGVSLFLAKHKALKRRDAADKNIYAPDFRHWWWANFTYDVIALVLFVSGAVAGLCAVGGLHLSAR